nr:uncharacterized protein LOC125990304 isoform X12 [Syngnathus scovelli]
MLRFKASTCIFTAQGLHLRQKTQIDCKKANELRLERRSELFLPAFFIGGAKGLGTSPLHGLKSKRQVVLVQAVRKQGVMIFQSWQCSFQCQSRRGSATFQQLGLMCHLKLLQQKLKIKMVTLNGVNVPLLYRQKWQILVQKVKNLPVCLHSVSSFTCQWSRSTCECCRGTFLLPGEPSAGWCTIKYLLAASGGQGSEHSSMLARHTFLLRPCLQVNLRSGQYLHLRRRLLVPLADYLTTRPAGRLLDHSSRWPTTRPAGRPLHHSSRWPTTSPLVPLADHFTTRPAGRPLHHSSRWPTTSPLGYHAISNCFVIECLLCKRNKV